MDLLAYYLGKKNGGGGGSTAKFAPPRLSFANATWDRIPTDFWEGFDSKNLTDVSHIFESNELKNEDLDLSFLENARLTDISYMFNQARVNSVNNFDKVNLHNVIDLRYAFCFSGVGVRPWMGDTVELNIPNGKNFMYFCRNTVTSDLSQSTPARSLTINVDYPEDMSYAFGCRDLEELIINTKSTTNLKTMAEIACYTAGNRSFTKFAITSTESNSGNISLIKAFGTSPSFKKAFTSVDLSGLRGKTATVISQIFYNCSSLTKINLSGIFLATNITQGNCTSAFYGCSSLQELDIRDFEFKNVPSAPSSMMKDVPTSCKIIVKDETEVAWWNSKFPTYVNVVVAE